MNLDNYLEGYSALITNIRRVTRERREIDEYFLGVLIYNCGFPEAEDIMGRLTSKKIEIGNTTFFKRSLEWKVVRIGTAQKTREVIKGLRIIKDKIYLIIDILSEGDPLENYDHIYGIDLGKYFKLKLRNPHR